MKQYNVAVVGASGAVGEELFRVLEEQNFPIGKLLPLASANSAGNYIEFAGQKHRIEELTESVFEGRGIDIAFFSAGGSISEKYAKYAVESGAVVIDNTSHFRMVDDVPLVVPEINPEDIALWQKTGIIANPNCSTIQMVLALKPLHDEFGIKRVDVSTYQATSGAGKKGMEELINQMKAVFNFQLEKEVEKREAFAHQIALNVIPHIDKFMDNGYTKEEMKMVNETNKIMHTNMAVSATCVRVPVLRSHSEAITIHCEKDVDVDVARKVLNNFEDVEVMDDPANNVYPMPIISTDTDITFVGRIRKDNFDSKILHFWVVADQVRVGAATNAVRIAKKWIEMEGKK